MSAVTVEQWVECGKSPFHGWRHPHVLITREAIEDGGIVRANRFHVEADYEFASDVHSYVWWPLLPGALLYFWWMRHRWVVERTLSRRIFDVREGHHLSEWKLRPLKRWTWRRTR